MTHDTFDRRRFLELGLTTGAVLALGQLPLFARGPAGLRGDADRVLVVVQLSGGNDGLSMVVPHGMDEYASLRRATRHAADDILTIDRLVGLNPGMKGLKALYDQGQLAIMQGCSYPEPNRSHFKSMDIWHTADTRGNHVPHGWIGRFADTNLADLDDPNLVVSIGNAAPLAVRGGKVKPVAFSNPATYQFVSRADQKEVFEKINEKPKERESTLDFLRRTSQRAQSSSAAIRRAVGGYQSRVDYTAGARLGADLRAAAAIIASDIPTRVIYVTLGGFDTHVNQKNAHDNLMRALDGSLAAFHQDLARAGLDEKVVTMVFSEFGRRPKENASGGTDHGVAGPMLVLGKPVRGGLYGKQPSLTDLDGNGDLKMQLDFRSVYATVLEDWMQTKSRPVLNRSYPTVKKLLRG